MALVWNFWVSLLENLIQSTSLKIHLFKNPFDKHPFTIRQTRPPPPPSIHTSTDGAKLGK